MKPPRAKTGSRENFLRLVEIPRAFDAAKAGLVDLVKTPGLNAATAKLVYDFFRDAGGGEGRAMRAFWSRNSLLSL
jgi:hypothetical protein